MGDRFGLWGDSTSDDKYGLWGGEDAAPRKRRTRSKRPASRDIENPVSPDADKDEPADDSDLMPELQRGPPPGAAGTPTPRPGRDRQSAWYEPLLESVQSFAQGGALNLGDEALAGVKAATDYFGLSHSGNSYAENADLYKKDADRVTHDYPVGHGAGQMATGLATGAALPGSGLAGYAAQGLGQGALSGVSEYADSRDLGASALAAGQGLASGVAGTWAGGKAAKLFPKSADAAERAALQRIWNESPVPTPEPRALPRPLPEPPAAPSSPDWTVEFPNGTPPNGTPGPRPTPTPEAPYAVGGLDTTPPPRPPSLPEASERELQQVALSRARAEMQPSKMSGMLRGASTLAALGGHPGLGAGLRAGSALLSPTERAGALASGYLKPNPTAAMRARMGVEMASELAPPALLDRKVNAQEHGPDGEPVAYAGQATMNYALTEALHTGNTGLSQQDEQALTDAVVKGDDDAIRATDFRLRQRYPAYARKIERALRSLNEEND